MKRPTSFPVAGQEHLRPELSETGKKIKALHKTQAYWDALESMYAGWCHDEDALQEGSSSCHRWLSTRVSIRMNLHLKF